MHVGQIKECLSLNQFNYKSWIYLSLILKLSFTSINLTLIFFLVVSLIFIHVIISFWAIDITSFHFINYKILIHKLNFMKIGQRWSFNTKKRWSHMKNAYLHAEKIVKHNNSRWPANYFRFDLYQHNKKKKLVHALRIKKYIKVSSLCLKKRRKF